MSDSLLFWIVLLVVTVVVFISLIGFLTWCHYQDCPTYHLIYNVPFELAPHYCPRCGDELHQYCDCGRELSDDDSFCRDCGASRPDQPMARRP